MICDSCLFYVGCFYSFPENKSFFKFFETTCFAFSQFVCNCATVRSRLRSLSKCQRGRRPIVDMSLLFSQAELRFVHDRQEPADWGLVLQLHLQCMGLDDSIVS